MSNYLNEIANFFSNGRPMSPGASWTLMALLAVFAVFLSLAFCGVLRFIDLAISNFAIEGPIGIWYAFLGDEVFEIRRERVISVAKCHDDEGGYIAHTSDGEDQGEYYVKAVQTKNKDAKRSLRELSRKDEETGETSISYVVCLEFVNEHEIEEILQTYFNHIYERDCKDARKHHIEVA